MMNDDDLSRASPASLAALMCGEQADEVWTAEDLAAMLRHQLQADVAADLSSFGLDAPGGLTNMLRGAAPPIRSFEELFTHPQPPAELLNLTRQFAKLSRTRDDICLPVEIATVLYLSSILAARLQCRQSITKLDDQALGESLHWTLQQPWLAPSLRGLLEAGKAELQLAEESESA